MVVRFGRIVEPGFLPVFSVDTEDDARRLLAASCSRNLDGEFVAEELTQNQDLDRLFAFGRRLERMWAIISKNRSK